MIYYRLTVRQFSLCSPQLIGYLYGTMHSTRHLNSEHVWSLHIRTSTLSLKSNKQYLLRYFLSRAVHLKLVLSWQEFKAIERTFGGRLTQPGIYTNVVKRVATVQVLPPLSSFKRFQADSTNDWWMLVKVWYWQLTDE